MTEYEIWARSKESWEGCVFGEITEQNRGFGGVWEALREMQQSFNWRGPLFNGAEKFPWPWWQSGLLKWVKRTGRF